MPVDSRLMDILACPVCTAPLRADARETALTCRGTGCGRAYPVVDGIPVLIVDESLAAASVSGALDA
ncbi:Trm112 family protein [Streptomyces sp. DH12]|uniref:Trm112 family protein n=1 Tax=Streptomyces sp. DH12 TaxID=2857010 RepID=UPI001E354FEC|nr:Trm112 family protein [Streptomyces sp. DH12]